MTFFSKQFQSLIFNYKTFSFFRTHAPLSSMKIFSNNSVFVLLFLLMTLMGNVTAQLSEDLRHLEDCRAIAKSKFNQEIRNYKANSEIQSSIQSAFPTNKNLLIGGLLSNNQTQVRESMRGNESKFALHIGIVAFFVFLLVVLIPVLLLTRFCGCIQFFRNKYQAKQQEGYSKCQINWPIILLLVLLLVLIGICAAILKINTDFEPKYRDFKCSLHLLTHNLLTGDNNKNQKIEFLGLENYKSQFNNFFNILKQVRNFVRLNLFTQSKPIKLIGQYLNFLLQGVKNLPVSSNRNFWIEYKNPLIGPFYQKTIPQKSIIFELLGNLRTPNSMVYNFSSEINQSISQTKAITTISDTLYRNLTKIQQYNGQVTSSIDSHVKNVQKIHDNIQKTTNVVDQKVLKTYAIGSYVVIGFCIAVCIGLALAVIFLFLRKVFLCRIGIYICCGLLWVIGILFFAIGIAFIFSNPGVLYGCQYLRESFSSQSHYEKNILAYNPSNEEARTIGKCLSSSSNPDYLYNQIIRQQIHGNISQTRDYLSINFDGQSQAHQLNHSFYYMLDSVLQYKNGDLLDFANQSMIEQVKRVAYTDDCFPDSWVPSHKANESFPCRLTGPNATYADQNSCHNVEDFMARGEGCTGCMDMSSILTFILDKIKDKTLGTILGERYKKCIDQDRAQIVQNLTDVYNRGFYGRIVDLTAAEQQITKLAANLRSAVKVLKDSLGPSHKMAYKWINSSAIFDPPSNSSMKNRMDCRVIGKGIENAVNVLCSSGIPYVYYLRFLYPIAGSLILLICGVSAFLLHRHDIQSKFEKKKKLEKEIRNNDQPNEAQNTDTDRKLKEREGNLVQNIQIEYQSQIDKKPKTATIIFDYKKEKKQSQT